jgi:hypothetical protein
MSKLTNISNQYKIKADKLLAKTGLIKTLEKFGKAYFVGSYAYDLMMNGDIDIEVVRAKKFTKKEVAEIFTKLYLADKFRSYFLKGNWSDPRLGKEFPNGNYIGLKEKIDGESWKIDIWFMSEEEFYQRAKKTAFIRQEITAAQRELILTLKKYKNDQKIYFTGYQIYELVLGGKVKSLKEFKEYLKTNA